VAPLHKMVEHRAKAPRLSFNYIYLVLVERTASSSAKASGPCQRTTQVGALEDHLVHAHAHLLKTPRWWRWD